MRSQLETAGVTRRETEVLDAVRGRLMNSEIAARLYVSERTVESHVSSLMRKLGAANRRQLAEIAAELAGESAFQRPPLPAPLELAASARPLVGRDVERCQLRELWERVAAGTSFAAVVTGEAGMGKSRLLADLAVEAHRQGASVLHGACFEDTRLPFEPFLLALNGDLDSLPDEETDRRRAVIARLSPLLLDLLEGGPRERRSLAETFEHTAVSHGLLQYLKMSTATGPVLVALEDVHWATATTRDALRHLVRSAGRMPLMVVVTCRDTAPDLEPETRILLGDLDRMPGVHRVALSGLDPASVRELAESTPHATVLSSVDATALVDETGGNPLFVLEMLASSSSPKAATSLHALLSARSRELNDDDNALLDLAAVLGAEFDAALLGAASGASFDTLLATLERGEAAGLVWSLPGGRGRWAFVHGLFRRARYDAIPAARRLRLHRAVARILAGRSNAEIAELARHAYVACPLGEARLAIDACWRAGDVAARASGVQEAVTHYRNALDAADLLDPPDPNIVCRLRARLGATLHNAGDPEGARLLLQAADTARTHHDADTLSTIVWSLGYYGSGLAGEPNPTIVDLTEEALALAGPDPSLTRARLLGLRAGQHAMNAEMRAAGALVDEALRIARGLADPMALGETLITCRLAMWTPENLDERLERADELANLGDVTGTRFWSIMGRLGLAAFRREAGDLTGSSQALDDVNELIGATPPIWAALLWTAMRSNRLFIAGDLSGAERVAAELFTLDLHPESGPVRWADPGKWHTVQLVGIRYYQGRLGELVNESEQVPFGAASRAIASCALAHVGDLAHASERLDADVAANLTPYPSDSSWLVAMGWLAETAELTRHVPAAEAIHQRLAPYLGRLDNYGDGASRPIGFALAQTALVAGDDDRAAELAALTVDWCRDQGALLFLGRALVLQAATRVRQGHRDTASLNEALAIAKTTGARLIEQDASRYELR